MFCYVTPDCLTGKFWKLWPPPKKSSVPTCRLMAMRTVSRYGFMCVLITPQSSLRNNIELKQNKGAVLLQWCIRKCKFWCKFKEQGFQVPHTEKQTLHHTFWTLATQPSSGNGLRVGQIWRSWISGQQGQGGSDLTKKRTCCAPNMWICVLLTLRYASAEQGSPTGLQAHFKSQQSIHNLSPDLCHSVRSALDLVPDSINPEPRET